MHFCIINLGCKVNSYECDFIKEKFIEKGYENTTLEGNPDVIVINTCSVTNQSDKKSRHMIRLARKMHEDAILVVTGCSAQHHQMKLQDLGVDILLGNKDKSKIPELVDEFMENRKPICRFYEMKDLEFEDMMLKSEENRTRAFIKIQDGCDNFCSYCIIPYMRGNLRSKDIALAECEIKSLVAMGHKEIVLTGIHTGSYGRGCGYDLVDLIKRISVISGLKRIRISSIEITELDEKFMKELASNNLICNHLHIPLQSGSDEILRRMNRKYDKEYYRRIIKTIRSIRLDISITTDLIVGFPYETDECFEETYEFLQEIGFTKIHTFPFSLRDGTKAEEMKDYFVDEVVKRERVKKILALSNTLEKEYYEKFIGFTLDIIVEVCKDGVSKGHTSNYILVSVEETLKEGEVYSIKITEVDNLSVKGVLVDVE